MEHNSFDGVTAYFTTYRAEHDSFAVTLIDCHNEPGVVKYMHLKKVLPPGIGT